MPDTPAPKVSPRPRRCVRPTCRAAEPALRPRPFVAALLLCTCLGVPLPATAQLPVGPSVASGTAAVGVLGNQMTVTNSPSAIINWQGFSIGAGYGVHFAQQSAASQVLNRVTGKDPSYILGSLTSNGGVWLINPYGVLFGRDARIDVGSLVASTLDIADADFLANRFNFTATGPAGASVVNQGEIRTSFGGRAWLLGEQVRNEGLVEAPGGSIVLAAGKSVEIIDSGTPNVVVQVSAPEDRAVNLGALVANGGRVDVHASIVNQDGIVHADGIGVDATGQIVLQASGELRLGAASETRATGGGVQLTGKTVETGGKVEAKRVRVTTDNLRQEGTIAAPGGLIEISAEAVALIAGVLDASDPSGAGGTVEVTADSVRLEGATIDASGGTQGGTVHLGGGWQGSGALAHAREVVVDAGSVVRTNGGAGRGGEIVLWSTGRTDQRGLLEARSGGRIEVSSQGLMTVAGAIDPGPGGEVLFDPKNLIIQWAEVPAIDVDEATFASDPAATSYILPSTITDLLIKEIDVTLQANNDILVRDGIFVIDSGNPGDLTLQAGRNIWFEAQIVGVGNLTAVAGDPAALAAHRDPGTPTIRIERIGGELGDDPYTLDANGLTTLAAVGGNVINDAGDFAIAGRFLIYAANPATTVEGFSEYNKHYNQTYTPGAIPSYAADGNWFLYSIAPVIRVTPDRYVITFGDPLPAFTGTLTGFIDGDTAATAGITGVSSWNIGGALSTSGYPIAGLHDLAFAGGLASSLGYQFVDDVASTDELTVKPLKPLDDVTQSSVQAERTAADLGQARVDPATGYVLDRTMAMICAETPSFDTLNLSELSREEAQQILDARKECKKELFADAIEQLERNPNFADVSFCTTPEEAQTGACRLTDAQRDQAAAADHRARAYRVRVAKLPQIERKVAVLFGIDQYADQRIPSLDNAVSDAEAVARVLSQKLGYEVRVVRNATKAEVVRSLNELATEVEPGDSVVIYYAGHGDVIDKTGIGYWLPSDASADDAKKWLSNDDVSRMLSGIKAKQLAMISDSCYSGTFAREQKVALDATQVRPETVLTRRSVIVMSSGGNEPVADSGRGGHSIFAWYLMQDLGKVNNWQAGTALFPSLRREVSRAFPQTPQYGASPSAGHEQGGDYLFEFRQLEKGG